MSITANRYHDISCGHRVTGHENKCAHLHGHNYRFHFFIEPYPIVELDKVGRVLDFSVIKSILCEYLEKYWDHKTLIWIKDPLLHKLVELDTDGIEPVSFNPTAENMAQYLVDYLAPKLLEGKKVRLKKVVIEETRKCSVTYEI